MYAGSRRAPPHVTRTRDEARALAEQALREAQQGAKFEDLVARYSDEPRAGARGGDLGKFPKGAMVSEFERALEKVAAGALSGVVETPLGFHVILRTLQGSRADLIRVDQRARGDAESSIPDRLRGRSGAPGGRSVNERVACGVSPRGRCDLGADPTLLAVPGLRIFQAFLQGRPRAASVPPAR
ncbi:peptidylprolyl isomerase [Sorangium sp. So ce429]